jgi:hypothetical protein
MSVEMAAGYCGERSAEAFLCRVGEEYPEPVVKAGRRQLWLKEDLDRAIRAAHTTKHAVSDVASGSECSDAEAWLLASGR